ncbi:MAG: PINc/VapC family ATPase [Haloferacaceae archaeon]|jgi:ATPase
MNVVPDTSAVVDGRVTERLDAGEYSDARILVPEAVVGELESQANEGRDSGWDGLAELQRLVDRAEDGLVVEYVGRRTTGDERSAAHEGDIDALIRDIAEDRDATLLTSDGVQAEVARAKGLAVDYVEPRGRDTESLQIESLFDDTTMSLHLRTGTRPKAKRGAIGDMHYETIREAVTTDDEMRDYAHDVVESARASPQGFVELEEPGMTIVQFGQYRIAVARPPFADAFEITAVRPIVKTDLDDYEFADELRDRLAERQRGVLISGAPGAGKSTFAQAVAEYLSASDYAVKTMEKPRDLQVGPDVTQYTELGGSMAKTADSLLMVRPDYTIYDEVRKTADFEVFSDMRLAGVGMVGVVHATRAIDALQRLVGRVELGMIPQVVDTVVYIEAGEVDTVYDVTTEVKVPAGLTAEDLARPVIRVRDFETGRPEYEIYTFNRQVVTVPVGDEDESEESGVNRIAKKEIEREIRSVARGDVTVDLEGRDRAVVYVDEDDISYVIGKGGGRIQEIEQTLGIDIDVRTHDERPSTGGASGGSDAGAPTNDAHGDPVQPEVTNKHVILPVDGHVGETVEVRADGEYLFTATVGRGGEVQVSRGSAIADELEAALDRTAQVTVLPA